MKFRVEHTFRGISLETYEKLYFDEPFNVALCEAVKLARSVIKLENDDKTFHRIVKVGPDRDIPKPVAKVLKADRIEYEEHNTYTFGTYKGEWKTIPMMLANKVKSAGTYSFTQKGDDVLRIVEGDIDIKILGVGGMIEKFICADVERSYDDAARFTQQWIDQGKHKELEG